MIIEFSVANFRSFKTLQTLSFEAAKLSSKDKSIDENNVFSPTPKIKLLKSKAIYGANASGKSNIVKAISAFWSILRMSAKNDNIISEKVQKFLLSTEVENEPTFFQLIFLYENITYRYGFEILENKVATEWLLGNPRGVEVRFFTREGRTINVNERSFKDAKKYEAELLNEDNEIFRENSLFLSAISAMGEKFAKNIVSHILDLSIIRSVNDPLLKVLAGEIINKDSKNTIIELMKSIDDIESIEVMEKDREREIADFPEEVKKMILEEGLQLLPDFYTVRNVFDVLNNKINTVAGDFEEWESEGTKKLFYLAPLLIKALERGTALILDEFDARLHPRLAKKIVQLFNSNITNPKNAQLLVVTHNTSFIDLFRRDQICLIEKDKYGCSTIKNLIDFKGVRNDASYEKDYLEGKYGATRHLNLEKHF